MVTMNGDSGRDNFEVDCRVLIHYMTQNESRIRRKLKCKYFRCRYGLWSCLYVKVRAFPSNRRNSGADKA